MKAIILAGGSGTRLWPLSRKNYPKQFLKFKGGRSLLQQTADRLSRVISPSDVLIITGIDYKFYVLSDLNSLAINNIILEPASRNTAPAIALGVAYCRDRLGCKEDEVIFICPSDHIITPADTCKDYLEKAEEIAKNGFIVTFGIKPTRPESGYGYIKVMDRGLEIGNQKFYRIEKFTEKPDAETAKGYLCDGNYFWNSGMFAFKIDTIMKAFKEHEPRIASALNSPFDEIISNFSDMPDISIDYAVMEKSNRVVTMPLDLHWSDIGSWDALYEVLDKDEAQNIKLGEVVAIDTKGTMIIGNKRLISTIGLEDCLIVETDDALLIAKKGETQKVKEIVDRLKRGNRKEALEHLTTYRPWGKYTVLEEGKGYKIKRIVVDPKNRLSLQMHRKRSEHWVVVSGCAIVTCGESVYTIGPNQSTFVPVGKKHRLENPGNIPLQIIEIQNGDYLGEDDIVRYEDDYER